MFCKLYSIIICLCASLNDKNPNNFNIEYLFFFHSKYSCLKLHCQWGKKKGEEINRACGMNFIHAT